MKHRVKKQFKLSQPPAGVSTDLHLEGMILDLSPEAAAELGDELLEPVDFEDHDPAKGKKSKADDDAPAKGKK
jgi:hypothetical protein